MTSGNAQRRQSLAGFEKTATRIAVAMVIAGPVLGIVAGMLGAAEVYPYDYAVPVALTTMLVPIGLALLIGAVGGLYIMGGWKIAPFGVVFVAGFAGLVYGIAGADRLWRAVGIGLLALSGAVFYLYGVVSERIPPSVLNIWGNGGALVVGAVLAAVGYATDNWGLLLVGAMAAGCGAGGLLGRWWIGRQPAG